MTQLSTDVQIGERARKLATQVDEHVIALRQKSAPRVTEADAQINIRNIAPLIQALIRYQLAMLDSLGG